jgi:nitrogen fixation NifU-like protein
LYSDRILDHFRSPRNVGELPPPGVEVTASNPACGDIMRLWVRWENGCVEAARFKTRGCTASIACGSILTELIQGKSAHDLRQFSAKDLEDAAGGLPPASRHAAVLCADTVRALLATVR